MRRTKLLCLLFVFLLSFSANTPVFNIGSNEPVILNASGGNIKVNSNYEIENEKFTLTANENGEVQLLVKETGEYWYSNPVDEEINATVKGINKMKMMSQLIVTYLVDESNEKQATSRASATNRKGITVKADKSGIRIDYTFVKEEFVIPVLYSIDTKGMTAQILNSEIKETGENTVTKIILLPYWGAASTKENGYFLVPDGSGALINFNNGKSTSNYQQNIYNTDGLMNIESSVVTAEKALMPVFGIKTDDKGALAVIRDGESCCKLYSFVSSGSVPYNTIYPEFTFRKSANITMLSKTWYPLEVTFISNKKVTGENFAVKYIPLLGEDKGYSGMANEYREYLKNTDGFEIKTKKNYVPVYLDVYASVLVSDNFLGFPITKNKSLTSCSQAKDIISYLNKKGISDINIRYKGITEDGLYNEDVPEDFSVADSIGGEDAFADLVKFASKKNTVIYPDYDFIFFEKGTSLIFEPGNVIQDVRHKSGIFYKYDISSGVKKSDGMNYALKVKYIENSVNYFLKSYKKSNSKSLSLSTLGNTLFSDYGSDICLSGEMQDKFEAIMQKVPKNNMNLMLEAPNMYAAYLADAIIAAPTDNSKYDIEDKSVPFYQMVLHGLVSYSTTSINSLADSKTAMLKAIETGSSVMYSLSSTEYYEIINDGYDELSCIYSEDWLSEIADNGKTVYNALKGVSNSEIVAHSEVENNVFCTKYDNGTSIYVNYTDSNITINEIEIGAKDFCVVGGESR